MKGKYFVYMKEVHQIKRVNKLTVSTERGQKIEKRFVWNAILGDSDIDACEKYIEMIKPKLDFAIKMFERSGYDSDERYANRYRSMHESVMSLLVAIRGCGRE